MTRRLREVADKAGVSQAELQNPIFPAFAEAVTGALVQRGFTPALCARTIGGVSEAHARRPTGRVRHDRPHLRQRRAGARRHPMERVAGAPEELFFEPELVLRGSTAAAP